MRQEVAADSLAALMVLDPELEPVPEPFRMQPDVQLVVYFDEYLKFIESLPSDTYYLYHPTSKLKEFIQGNKEEDLVRSFYVDIAFAVGKELAFATKYGHEATPIRHAFYDCTAQKTVTLTPETYSTYDAKLKCKGFPVLQPLGAKNRKHWDYACKLLQDAAKGPTRWVEK